MAVLVKRKKKAIKECEKLIKKYNLNMKLINAEYTFDKQKVIFTITGNPPGGGIRTIIRPESGGTPYSIFKDGTTPAVQITNYWCAVGTTYYIYVPKSELNSIDKFILNVQYGSKDGKVSLVRRNLFELQ